MAEFTLLELHLDDAEFIANAPFSASDDAETASGQSRSQAESSETDGAGGPRLGLLALLALAVVAVAVVVLRGSEDDADGSQ